MFTPNEAVTTAVESISDKGVKEKIQNFLAMLSSSGEGLGEGEEGGFQIPFLRLLQGTTKPENMPEGASPGSYVIGSGMNSEVLGKAVKFYLLSVQKGRTYFRSEDGNDANVKLYCWSPDRVVGKLGNCDGCPFAEKDESGKSPCSVTVPVIGMTEDLELIFQFTFAKTGFMEGTKIAKFLRTPRGYKATYDMPWTLTASTHATRTAIRVPVLNAVSEGVPEDLHAFLKALSNQINSEHVEFTRLFHEQVGQSPAALEHDGATEAAPVTQQLKFDIDSE